MKRLCVFYNKRAEHLKTTSAHVEWIVCKECQKKLKQGHRWFLLRKAARELYSID